GSEALYSIPIFEPTGKVLRTFFRSTRSIFGSLRNQRVLSEEGRKYSPENHAFYEKGGFLSGLSSQRDEAPSSHSQATAASSASMNMAGTSKPV
ncbi:hypothetical protein, partial [Diaphorobacter caeni]|uniref:hypothetical protein n=1 Tax=Diaphorobacter caeni TaxID=2784387 RepID=UPI001E38DE34